MKPVVIESKNAFEWRKFKITAPADEYQIGDIVKVIFNNNDGYILITELGNYYDITKNGQAKQNFYGKPAANKKTLNKYIQEMEKNYINE